MNTRSVHVHASPMSALYCSYHVLYSLSVVISLSNMEMIRLLLSAFGSFSTTPKPFTVVTERFIVMVASSKSILLHASPAISPLRIPLGAGAVLLFYTVYHGVRLLPCRTFWHRHHSYSRFLFAAASGSLCNPRLHNYH